MVSAGVKTADSVWPAPAFSTVPIAGVYANVPDTLAAAFSCAPPSAVPNVIPAGGVQVIAGVALATSIVTVAVTLENGRLFRQLPGRSKDELYPESESKFFVNGPAEPRLSFIKDEKGEVVEMIHTQVGGEWRAKKIKATK